MLQKVLVANRGAIACRVIRTLKKLGISAVAVYAEADAESLHVSAADEAFSLGEGHASETYLNQAKLLAVIEQCGAQAVHPGYGFLSENTDFCRALEARGVRFVGPTAEQIMAFGLKHEARALAQQNQVPLLPGSGLLDSLDAAVAEAESIGFPVMLKSTAGGGGIGMQVCANAEQVRGCWDSIKRLGANNFSNSGVFLEKYIERARHVEVQVFGDGEGGVIVLGDRDCSCQRRHQKVIEEAPAPDIAAPVRAELHAVAKRLVAAVNYRNAGTVEFIYDAEAETFYFLEVNTRLQVEHGVTEMIYGVDLVEWMVQLPAGQLPPLRELEEGLQPRGHAVQARLYAENPARQFQPSVGQVQALQFPATDKQLRIDHWLDCGLTVSPFFDPMLAKVIYFADDRQQALAGLTAALEQTVLEGLETNREYLLTVLQSPELKKGAPHTRFLGTLPFTPLACEVLTAGTMTTVQDWPGRVGYWHVGVPPSGPFDSYSMRLGNRLLGNAEGAAALEITLTGPTLKFHCDHRILLAGAPFAASLDEQAVDFWRPVDVKAGQTLRIGKANAAGARAYLLFAGGLNCADYLGAKATFTLGQFGGWTGRALRAGDMLHLNPAVPQAQAPAIPESLLPQFSSHWQVRVIYGPHGAPDFFTGADIDTFFASRWQVHYNSSRTGIRLIGPKPQWARSDGGEAGMHPSNIHDNAYALGSIDFTGDMPVILGPDGPSLGGFVCPATVISADLWKLGQLRAGDTLQFIPVSFENARALLQQQNQSLAELVGSDEQNIAVERGSPVVKTIAAEANGVQVVYRLAGDQNLLIEYGPQELDLRLRLRVHQLMQWLEAKQEAGDRSCAGIKELTPGIRSLQVHFNPLQMDLQPLLDLLARAEGEMSAALDVRIPSRIMHLPLSWNDEACRLAVQKYMQSVRKDAPWCPDNIEFIRRINGLESVQAVKDIVFDARYVVMGLGDVYLGAPVATPLDPRHRLVTTKYNPARTWTAENSVGIGGSYLCVYGMEGPGGYQFIGRTLQMWNRHRRTREFEQPWLLRFFDQIRFYEVSQEELVQIRKDFPLGRYPLKIEQTEFSLAEYQQFLQAEQSTIESFTRVRQQAFAEELARWQAAGQLQVEDPAESAPPPEALTLADGAEAVESPVAGSIWQVKVQPGEKVAAGVVLCVLESMKMEIEITAPVAGTVERLLCTGGQPVAAGQVLAVVQATKQEGVA